MRVCRARHGDACGIREEHIICADLLRSWADGAAIGFTALRDGRPVTAIHYRPITGPGVAAMRQLRCWRDFARVMRILTEAQRSRVSGLG